MAHPLMRREVSAPEGRREASPGPLLSRPRTVEIAPPSRLAEALHVSRAAALVVCGAWLYIANTAERGAPPALSTRAASQPGAAAADVLAAEAAAGRHGGAAGGLMPFQRLFAALDAHDQRLFRALREGLLEAERIRSAGGRWPAVAELAVQQVPPFAADPIGARDRYAWTFHQQGTLVDYLGLPASAGPPAFLLQLLEPEPQAPPHPPIPPDEQHDRLGDGTLIHVSIWTHPPGLRLADRLVEMPPAEGWVQILAGSP